MALPGASRLALRLYGIFIEPNRFEEYWRLMRSANVDAEMNTFLKRVSEQPDLKNKPWRAQELREFAGRRTRRAQEVRRRVGEVSQIMGVPDADDEGFGGTRRDESDSVQ